MGEASDGSMHRRENETNVDVARIKVCGLLTTGRCSQAKICFVWNILHPSRAAFLGQGWCRGSEEFWRKELVGQPEHDLCNPHAWFFVHREDVSTLVVC